ncbi:MAG: LTA synthase family protein [Lachnospiraceae bacterium]|nr:LTA synthase family protein [Lachnospiraceae bacterium]
MKKQWKNRMIYLLLVTGLIWLYVTYVPCLMDYYVCRPEMSFLDFFQRNLNNHIYLFESTLLAFVVVLFFCLTWNGGVSVGITSLLVFVLTHGSYVKYMNRKEMLRLEDFLLTEAAGLAAGYFRFEFSRYLLVLVGGLLLFAAAGVGLEKMRSKYLFPDKKKKTFDREMILVTTAKLLTAGFVFFVMVFGAKRFMLSELIALRADAAKLVEAEDDRYVLYRFVKNDRLDQAIVETTDKSYEYLLAEEERRPVEEANARPNVIVIMNESWWNTNNVDSDKVKFSVDPMLHYKRLYKRCVTGHLTSNVYGGGTISSEAEFLTGLNTKYYVTSSTIYEKTKNRKLPSVVDYFNALDYETVAIHPYYGDFYNREDVYETMGFDESIFEEDMVNREIYTRYISDNSLAKEIIAEYEEQEDEANKFIWSVSVSNHRRTLAYHIDSVEDYKYPISVELLDEEAAAEMDEEDYETLVNYINGIYYAGKAYSELVDYFSKREEPVIVVMFGDHVPNFSPATRTAIGLSEEKNMTEDADVSAGNSFWDWFREDVTSGDVSDGNSQDMSVITEDEPFEILERLYSVPVIMWSNFELENDPDFEGESIYYLSQMILESAGLPDSEMSLMLANQREVFRANSREFVLDSKGEPVTECTEEQLETLNHSKTVIYDIMFGKEMRENVWMPVKK